MGRWECDTWQINLPETPTYLPARLAEILRLLPDFANCDVRILEMIHQAATEALLYPRLNIMKVQT
jgi:hypothetical protein